MCSAAISRANSRTNLRVCVVGYDFLIQSSIIYNYIVIDFKTICTYRAEADVGRK